MFNNEEENLVEIVASLRTKLRLTEIHLQTLGKQVSCNSGHDSHSERCDQSPSRGLPGRLTIEDLQRPDATQPRPSNPSLPSVPLTQSTSGIVPVMEPAPLRKKLGSLRQENASLVLEKRQLISDLEAAQYELASSNTKIHLLGSTVGAKTSSVTVMREQILGLEAELETQAKELRATELRVEQGQQAAALSNKEVAQLREELSALRTELIDRTRQGKRAEQQRNQALRNAEKLTDAFKDYKANVSIKLKKVMESERKLKESLIECDREREELESKCTTLVREKAEQSQIISQLKEEVSQARTLVTEREDLQTRLKEAGRLALRLERELGERAMEGRELVSLRRETEDLRALTQCQEHRLAQSQREAQQIQAELASLEAILALLHLKEDNKGPLCVKPCMLPVDYTETTEVLQPKAGERYQQLLPVLQAVETERSRQSSLAQRLQERLSAAQGEISCLQSSMAQRASHYQQLHSELLEKASQATDTEKELKRKSARVAALEKHLQEKTSAYSQAAMKNSELEKEQLEKARSIQHYQSVMTKKQREFQQALEKCKKAHTEQNKELQDRVEVLQLSQVQTQALFSEMEQAVCSAQRERQEAQNIAHLLQASLDQLTQDKDATARCSEEALQSVRNQAAESAVKVRQLETALSSCRDELNSYLQQMEEAKEQYERQLEMKSRELSSLQEELCSTTLVYQSSSEQSLQLQYSLQLQQSMLQESNTRVVELEESQIQLQGQVSRLEQELERVRSSLDEELRRREEAAQETSQEMQEKRRQAVQLSDSVMQLTSEMTKCRGEMSSMEQELQCLKRDASSKASQLSHMEEMLQQTQGLLEKKQEMVADLEEKLHRSEADRRNSVQRAQVLEGQLQLVRSDLADTLDNLQKLRDVLQRTQLTADERQVSLEKLASELRESQRELEERSHEVLDMDTALKKRHGELQQRAQLLGQLDVAIRDHKLEMEKKVLSLQQTLGQREGDVKDRDKQVELLSERLDLLITQLQGKEDLEKDTLEQGQHLRVCREKLLRTTQELQDTQNHCESLNRELDSITQHTQEKAQLHLEEELAGWEARWAQGEGRLQATVTSLQQELEQEREQHSKELSSLQQTRGQLLKVSEQISCSMRSSQEQLSSRLQQSQAQLEQARVEAAHLKTQLHTREKTLQGANEALLIKESEVTRLQARISSLERAADLHHSSLHLHQESTLPLSPPHTHTHTHPRSPPPTHTCTSSPPRPTQAPDWSRDSVDSLDLPQSLKATLREALTQHPWDSSLSPSPTSYINPDPDQSWQGLSRLEATSATDLSFNPLTYMVDKLGEREGDRDPEKEHLHRQSHEEEMDMSSLTGMLKFVNQTLALQEDPSLWGNTGLSESDHTLTLKGDLKEGGCCLTGDL